jgi:hypothetical protein
MVQQMRFLAGLDPEAGSYNFLHDFAKYLPVDTVSYPKEVSLDIARLNILYISMRYTDYINKIY